MLVFGGVACALASINDEPAPEAAHSTSERARNPDQIANKVEARNDSFPSMFSRLVVRSISSAYHRADSDALASTWALSATVHSL
jgi:hypothetical protein